MAGKIKNTAASVHQRLLSKARESSRPFNELLQYFAIERFIYRLSRSRWADRFILKGALMFSAWGGHLTRPTMDIDLLGRIDNSLEVIIAAMKEACEVKVEADESGQVCSWLILTGTRCKNFFVSRLKNSSSLYHFLP